LRPGDSCRIEWLEGDRRVRELPVAAVVDEPVGTSAYLSLDALERLVGEPGVVTGAYLAIDRAAEQAIFDRLRNAPAVGGVTDSAATLATFDHTNAKYLRVFSAVLVVFAALIALAVVYNAARILVAERERELATLRVLGLRRGEVLGIVLAELGAQVALAIPLGWALGFLLSLGAAKGTSSELFRIPVVIAPATYLWAAAVLAAAIALVAVAVRARVHGLDLIAVLKTKE
jgi:putative ABC transport system permease protein